MLDKYYSFKLIEIKNERWINKCLSNPKLTNEEKFRICVFGSDYEKRLLIERHNLNYACIQDLYRYGNDVHRIALRRKILSTKYHDKRQMEWFRNRFG